MELKVTTLEGKEAGSVQLSDAIFGLDPRADIIQRCVQWQLNKRQAGTHKTQGRADVWRTGKKMYKQKGTGGARHGSARVPQFRGGGRAFGPVVRSHETDLPTGAQPWDVLKWIMDQTANDFSTAVKVENNASLLTSLIVLPQRGQGSPPRR